MPTYTYQCQTCGVTFDKYQKFTDKPLTRCPECRKGTVRRLVQPAAVVFKGSGWYKTDSRSSSSSSPAKAKDTDSGSDKPAEKSSDTSTESKPAKKAAANSDD